MRNFWIVPGKITNWKHAFLSNGIWGFKDDVLNKVYWLALSPGDLICFYVTNPTKRVIGYGTVRTKFIQNIPLWPDELQAGVAKWPLRFEFDIDFILPENQWQEMGAQVSGSRAIYRDPIWLKSLDDIRPIIEALNPGVPFDKIAEEVAIPQVYVEEKETPSHDQVKKILMQIGRLQNYVVNPEYPMGNERLDVVWRRLPESVPTYAYEVHIGGDLYHALAKLKHAHDLWNSKIFLVAGDEIRGQVNTLLSGTFHEIQADLKFIGIAKAQSLYQTKTSIYEIERELGILP